MGYESIPAEMKELRQWVCWKLELNPEGKLTKVPYNAKNGHRGSSTSSLTWCSFELAVRKSEHYNGIGFVFTKNDPFCGIDLDNCMTDSGVLDDGAKAIIDRLNTYTEKSQSGKGIHCIIKGDKQGERCKQPNIELYEQDRYFAMTGDIIPGYPRTVENRQKELEKLYTETFICPESPKTTITFTGPADYSDQELIDQAIRNHKNGDDIARLWRGDTSGHKNDDSGADQALCNHLAFLTGKDPIRMDRMFRMSGLMRPKWDSKRPGGTYGSITIQKAIDSCRETYNGPSGQTAVESPAENKRTAASKKKAPSNAELLLNEATSAINEIFKTPDNIYYVNINYQDQTRTMPVKSADFRHFLRELWQGTGKGVIGGDAVKTVVDCIESRGWAAGITKEVHIRVASHKGNVYIDLANDQWEAVEITGSGWKIINNPPVTFVRGNGVLPLPRPEPGGSIDLLKPFANVSTDGWMLLIGFLLGTLNPRPPYPILAIYGEQGSGKSTLARVIKSLIDPGKPMLRTSPSDDKNVISAAQNSWIVGYSNLSDIPDWLSDLLCCISTDGGYTTRTLYETLGETTFEGMRPVIINGISDLIWRSDLLDRAIQLNLEPISESQRKEEETYWIDFDATRPKILGALYDAVSCAIRCKSSIRLEQKPRMADFAKWVCAAEDALPWINGLFLSAYEENRSEASYQAIASDPVAQALLKFIENRTESQWKGTASDLLDAIAPMDYDIYGNKLRIHQGFPQNGISLGKKLRRLAPNLRNCGCNIEDGYQRNADGRKERAIVVSRVIKKQIGLGQVAGQVGTGLGQVGTVENNGNLSINTTEWDRWDGWDSNSVPFMSEVKKEDKNSNLEEKEIKKDKTLESGEIPSQPSQPSQHLGKTIRFEDDGSITDITVEASNGQIS